MTILGSQKCLVLRLRTVTMYWTNPSGSVIHEFGVRRGSTSLGSPVTEDMIHYCNQGATVLDPVDGYDLILPVTLSVGSPKGTISPLLTQGFPVCLNRFQRILSRHREADTTGLQGNRWGGLAK